jgi:hypothetical protein
VPKLDGLKNQETDGLHERWLVDAGGRKFALKLAGRAEVMKWGGGVDGNSAGGRSPAGGVQ